MPEVHAKFKNLAAIYRTPKQVQRFIHSLAYNTEENGKTIKSALLAVNTKKAHCLEASFVAAAILEVHGYPTLVMDLESKDGLDHVVFVFKENGRWGAIGRSREADIQGRAPVFRSIRDLAWSYFDPYVDRTGRLKGYQIVNLDETKTNWRTGTQNLWKAENFLINLPHKPMRSSNERYKKLLRNFAKGQKLPVSPHWW